MTSSPRNALALIGSAAIITAAAACGNTSTPNRDTTPTEPMNRDTYTSQTVTMSPSVTDTLAPSVVPGDTGTPGGTSPGGPTGTLAPGAGSGAIPGGPSGAYGPGGATGTIPGVGGGSVTMPPP